MRAKANGHQRRPTIPYIFAVPWLLTWTIILDRWSWCGCHERCNKPTGTADLPEPHEGWQVLPRTDGKWGIAQCQRQPHGGGGWHQGGGAECMASNHGNSGRTSLQARSSPEPRSPKPPPPTPRRLGPGLLSRNLGQCRLRAKTGRRTGEIETELGRAVEARGAYIAVSKACAAALADVEALLGELVERKQRLEDLCELAEQLAKVAARTPKGTLR